MAAFTTSDIPPLPSFTLQARAPLIPPIPDKYLSLIMPVIAYWALSMVFHYIDTYDLFSHYRLHTPAEVLKRNHVSRWEVVRDVVVQQVVQTMVGIGLAAMEEDEFDGKDGYNVALWAQRIRLAQRAIPRLLALVGIDAQRLAQGLSASHPVLAGALAGGRYAGLVSMQNGKAVAAFAPWETSAANLLYWIVVPAFQFGLAILIVDTWQYFLHRAMHMNKWLYTTFHSRHHRLYVPYAYGALYNHPFEGFLLDTLGTGIAYLVTGLTPRQGMCFFTGSTIKTVDDHCGYALPWDPLQHITSNNAGYHDVHHQSWGIKTNFSQPFFTFWDRLLGTAWTGGDVSARYERARLAAERKIAEDGRQTQSKPTTASKLSQNAVASETIYYNDAGDAVIMASGVQVTLQPAVPAGKASAQALASREQVVEDPDGGGSAVLLEETAEENEAKRSLRKSPRKRTMPSGSPSTQAGGSLKGLRDRVKSFHGRTGGVLGYESTR